MPHELRDWEKAFDDLWLDFENHNAYGYPEQAQKVKLFIQSTITQEVEKAKKKENNKSNTMMLQFVSEVKEALKRNRIGKVRAAVHEVITKFVHS